MLATVQAAYRPTGTVQVEWTGRHSGSRRRLRTLAAFRFPPQCAGSPAGFSDGGAEPEYAGSARTAFLDAGAGRPTAAGFLWDQPFLNRDTPFQAQTPTSDAAGFAAASAAVNDALEKLRRVEEALERQLQDLRSYRKAIGATGAPDGSPVAGE